MSISAKLLGVFALVALVMAGCEQMPGMASGAASVAIIDLGAVAKATGQEEEIQQQAEAARNTLNAQLQEAAASLEAQLTAEQDKIGATPTAEQQQQMQQLAGEAQRQYAAAQQQAQNQSQQFETNLVMAFREKVKPVAEQIGLARGAKVIMLADITMFWFDPSADITDEVIAKLRSDPGILASAEPESALPEPAASDEALPVGEPSE